MQCQPKTLLCYQLQRGETRKEAPWPSTRQVRKNQRKSTETTEQCTSRLFTNSISSLHIASLQKSPAPTNQMKKKKNLGGEVVRCAMVCEQKIGLDLRSHFTRDWRTPPKMIFLAKHFLTKESILRKENSRKDSFPLLPTPSSIWIRNTTP